MEDATRKDLVEVGALVRNLQDATRAFTKFPDAITQEIDVVEDFEFVSETSTAVVPSNEYAGNGASLDSPYAPPSSPTYVRPRKKQRIGSTEPTADPVWTSLALRYLVYARKLACHTKQPIHSVRQLPSITHMIAIGNSEMVSLEEFNWRWCDAYHAIKYLKDSGLVLTSRGSKGTSIKDDAHTIDHLIGVVQARSHTNRANFDQQGQALGSTTVTVTVHRPNGKDRRVAFSILTEDLHSLESLSARTVQFLYDEYGYSVSGVKLTGYVEKGDSRDFIHANTFTSVDELAQDASEICLSARQL